MSIHLRELSETKTRGSDRKDSTDVLSMVVLREFATLVI